MKKIEDVLQCLPDKIVADDIKNPFSNFFQWRDFYFFHVFHEVNKSLMNCLLHKNTVKYSVLCVSIKIRFRIFQWRDFHFFRVFYKFRKL
jgi:hypothetical protein